MHLSRQQNWRRHQRVEGRALPVRMAFRAGELWSAIVEFLDRGESEAAPHRRVQLLAGVIALLTAGVVYRLYDLQQMEFPRWSEIASKQHLSTVKVHGARGTIYDTQGRVLAVSIKSLSIAAHPQRIHEPAISATRL